METSIIERNDILEQLFSEDHPPLTEAPSRVSKYELTLNVPLHKLIVAIFNPQISFSELNAMSSSQFATFADITPAMSKGKYKKLFFNIRETLDGLLYGNLDFDTTTFSGLWKALQDEFSNINLSPLKVYLKAYVQKVVSTLYPNSSPLKEPPQLVKKSEPQIHHRKSWEILASIRNIPGPEEGLAIVPSDSETFFVVGKNMPSHYSKLLSMGGSIPHGEKFKDIKKSILKFPTSSKKKIREYLFEFGLSDSVKTDKLRLLYARKKFVLYLDASIIFMEANRAYFRDNKTISRDVILVTITQIYECHIPLQDLQSEKITTTLRGLIMSIIRSLNPEFSISPDALSLLVSAVFYQTHIVCFKDLSTEEDFSVIQLRIQDYSSKLLEKGPLKMEEIFDSLFSAMKRLNPPSYLNNDKEPISPLKVQFATKLIIGTNQGGKKAVKHLQNILNEWESSGLKLREFLKIKQYPFPPLAEPSSEDKKTQVSLACSASYIRDLSRSNDNIIRRVRIMNI